MIGQEYKEGSTFRAPRLSNLRAEYAASLRDAGLSYSAIAWALGLHGKRRRAFQVVQYGRRLRPSSFNEVVTSGSTGPPPPVYAAPNYYGPLCAALREHQPRVDGLVIAPYALAQKEIGQ
jgi:hypothetical protein